MTDYNNPIWNNPFTNYNYEFGSPDNELSWNFTDSHPNSYEIIHNSTLNGGSTINGGWDSENNITLDIDGLEVGVYAFNILVYDENTNYSNYTIIVSVSPNVLPEFEAIPNDTEYEESSIGNFLTWNVSDSFPDYFEFYRNGSFIVNGTWTSLVNITLSIDGFLYGVHNFTLYVFDKTGANISDSVLVTVYDETKPIFAGEQIPPPFEELSSDNILVWNATDHHPDTYEILHNSTLNGGIPFTGTWSSDTNISLNIDGLWKGVYNFTLIVYDEFDNNMSSSVIITVFDASGPFITDGPNLGEYNELDENSVSWQVNDNHPHNYTIFLNGISTRNGTWVDNEEISFDLTGLDILYTTYNLTILVFDESGNYSNSTMLFIIVDDTKPQFSFISSSPHYPEIGTGISLIWNSTDKYPHNYTIFHNSTLNFGQPFTGFWTTNTNISLLIDGLDKGIYNFTVTVFDDHNNTNSSTIIVEVTDETPPTLETPVDFSILFGDQIIIQWNASDIYPDIYEVYRNNTRKIDSTWGSGTISYPIEVNLAKGVYNFTIVVYDKSGNSEKSTLFLTVILSDETQPVIETPNDYIIPYKTTGNSITWNVIDQFPDVYSIYQNGSEKLSEIQWSSGPISYLIDGLSVGLHNFTIVVTDTSGNVQMSTVFVTVDYFDEISPSLDEPNDITILYGSTGNLIIWKANDTYPHQFNLYINGTEFEVDDWVNDVDIEHGIDGLSVGAYNYTILVFDEPGNFRVDTVIVKIIAVNTLDPDMNTPKNQVFEDETDLISGKWLTNESIEITEYNVNVKLYLGSFIVMSPSSEVIGDIFNVTL
ncbi:MAG: hypothetical protein ACXAD7_27645, partial [Candidatus Kariarchaeaceae archaeon]